MSNKKDALKDVLSELDKVQRTRDELICEYDDMRRAKRRGCPPSDEEIQDYLTRKNKVEAEFKSLQERLREFEPLKSKYTPSAEKPRTEIVKTVKRLF